MERATELTGKINGQEVENKDGLSGYSYRGFLTSAGVLLCPAEIK